MGRTSTVIQPRSTPGQVLAISTASSRVSVSSTEYPPRASLVSMNGPSVTPPARTVLAGAGGGSWYPVSVSLPEPPPPFSYQAPISAYHAWPSASVMLLALSVLRSRMTYFTVASQVPKDATMASLHQFHERGGAVCDTTPVKVSPQAMTRCGCRPVFFH